MEFIKDLYWFCAIFVFVIVGIMGFVLPHTLRIFRISRIYNQALIISIILFLFGIGLFFNQDYDCLERANLLYPLVGITFLVIYKLSDNFIMKKLGRHMYYLTMWQIRDKESGQSTNLENVIQLLNLTISFMVPYHIGRIVVKIWYSC